MCSWLLLWPEPRRYGKKRKQLHATPADTDAVKESLLCSTKTGTETLLHCRRCSGGAGGGVMWNVWDAVLTEEGLREAEAGECTDTKQTFLLLSIMIEEIGKQTAFSDTRGTES